MNRLFIDTNIVVDLLEKREPFYKSAQHIFSLSDNNELKLQVSALTIANICYLLKKTYPVSEVRKIVITFKTLVNIVSIDDKIIELALTSDFSDFEDSLQYYSALESKCDIIITRNEKDFKKSAIPVMNAERFLVQYKTAK